MNIFLIDPKLTMQNATTSQIFLDTLVQEFQIYAIDQILVTEMNINMCKTKLESNSIIILFNGVMEISEYKNIIIDFVTIVKEVNALIWTIAMDRDSRIPTDFISKKQSHDVWEQPSMITSILQEQGEIISEKTVRNYRREMGIKAVYKTIYTNHHTINLVPTLPLLYSA